MTCMGKAEKNCDGKAAQSGERRRNSFEKPSLGMEMKSVDLHRNVGAMN